jgi:hypothetical protein
MPYAGEAAEQVIRIGLQGAEMALRVSGAGARQLVVLIAAAVSGREKTAGRARLASMLKSDKELKVFTVPERELKNFAKEAKRYGVLYCAVRAKDPVEAGMTDILVRAEDASKINRVAEKLGLATIDISDAAEGSDKPKDGKAAPKQDTPEKGLVNSEKEDQIVDELLGTQPEKKGPTPENPTKAEPERSLPSDSTSRTRGTSGKDTSESSRKSVRKEMDGIRKQRQDAPENDAARERENALMKRQQELGARTTGIKEGRTRA